MKNMMMRNREKACDQDSRTPNWKQVGSGWNNVRLDMTPKSIPCEFESLTRLSPLDRRLFVDR